MRVTVVLAAVAAMIISGVFVVKLLGERPPSVALPVFPKTREPEAGLDRDGPQPKAVIDEPEFVFGRMLVGEERTHDFVIRNEGDALLTVEFGDTTCQCTYSKKMKPGDKIEIPPGQSGAVSLTWKPTAQAERFGKGANLITNDPRNSKIRLSLEGMVTPRFLLKPEKDWILSDPVDGKPFTFSGLLGSPIIEHFNITAVECRNPLVSTEVIALDKERFGDIRVLSGYEIRVSVKPEMPSGAFSYPLTIKTDVPDITPDGPGKPVEFEVLLSGALRGPFRPTGREWVDDKMAISLGSFDAAAGKKITMPVVIKNPPAEGFKLIEPPVCTPEALKFELHRDEKSTGGTPRFLMTLEYPPGSPRVIHREDEPGRILLKTNHPLAAQIELHIFLSAY